MVLSKTPIYHQEMENIGNYVLGKQDKMRASHLHITMYKYTLQRGSVDCF